MLGRIFGISGKKIFRWYQESSGYAKEKAATKKAYETKTGKPRKKLSKKLLERKLKKIWKPENFGDKMGIDEKYIGGKFYTIINNLKTKKRDEAKRLGQIFVACSVSRSPLLSNGETELQLLARSRYLLFKFESGWSDDQKERSKILFEKYPDLKTAYKLIIRFRTFYQIEHDNNIPNASDKLQEWSEKVGAIDISEIQNFASMVARHRLVILNYFETGFTNALAESINNKIQRFIINNHGTRDPDFLFFRLQKFLT